MIFSYPPQWGIIRLFEGVIFPFVKKNQVMKRFHRVKRKLLWKIISRPNMTSGLLMSQSAQTVTKSL